MEYEASEPRRLDPRYKIEKYVPFLKPIPAPAANPDEPPFLCVRFNRDWLPVIMGALDAIVFEDVYTGTLDEQRVASQKAQLLLLMIALGNACEGEIMFRQNPADPCQLQQSFDGGGTWTTVFDYGLCPLFKPRASTADLQITVNILNEYYQETTILNNIYLDDPNNIAPSMDYDGTSGDIDRDKALCAALYAYTSVAIEVIRELKKKQEDDIDNFLEVLSFVFTAVAQVVATLAGVNVNPALTNRLANSLFLAGLGVLGLSFFDVISDEMLEDEAARQEVACCMFNALSGADITYNAFAAALDSPCTYVSEYGAQLHDAIQPLLSSQDTYLNFLALLEDMSGSVADGYEMPCDCPDWVSEMLFADDDYGFTVVPGFAGNHALGLGWYLNGEAASETGMTIEKEIGETIEFHTITVYCQHQCGSSSTVFRDQVIRWYEGESYGNVVHRVFCPSGDGAFSFQVIVGGTMDKLRIYTSIGALGTGAYVRILKVVITGSGSKPASLP